MLRIISYEITDNKVIRVRSSHPSGGKSVLRDEIFFSPEEARAHITSIRHTYLVKTFTDYVLHKKVLFASSVGDYYRVPSRLEALTRLINAIDVLKNMKTDSLCSTLIRSKQLLTTVLPHQANDSFESSNYDITSMMTVANEELTGKLGMFPFKSTKRQTYLT